MTIVLTTIQAMKFGNEPQLHLPVNTEISSIELKIKANAKSQYTSISVYKELTYRKISDSLRQ